MRVRFVSEKELSTLTPREIAATVGYLGHDPELSADTLEHNVLCGSEQEVTLFSGGGIPGGSVSHGEAGRNSHRQQRYRLSGPGPAAGTGADAGASASADDPGRSVFCP